MGLMRLMVSAWAVLVVAVGVSALGVAHAGWGDPVVVVSGGWGEGASDFYFFVGDSTIEAPEIHDVSNLGKIAIADDGKGRAVIYNPDGSFSHHLVLPVPDSSLYAYYPKFIGESVVVPADKIYFYGSSGELTASSSYPPGTYRHVDAVGAKWFIQMDENGSQKWYEFSEGGAISEIYDQKPLTLGKYLAKDIVYKGELYKKSVIEFGDITLVHVSASASCNEHEYRRSEVNSTQYFCNKESKVTALNQCGRIVSEVFLPEDEITVLNHSGGVEPTVDAVQAHYTDAIVAPNGDIYSSKSSDSQFSIIKWSWDDNAAAVGKGPFPPEQIAAGIQDERIVVSWSLSPHDEGCVSGYEIWRATSAGGPYAVLDTVVKSTETYTDATAEPGTTYYYAVRAVSAIGNSGYSNEVSAQVP